MANVLTAVAPVLYSAARIVPRELVGLLGAVRQDFNDKGVAKGDTVKIGVAPVLTVQNVTPAQTFSAGNDRTMTSSTLALNQFKEVTWNLTPEEERSLMNSTIAQDILAQTVTQGFRALVNAIEIYMWGVARVAASRSFGVAGTTPFGSNFNEIANLRKILDDNGAPSQDRALVINTTAGVSMRNLAALYQVYSRGSDATLAQGVLLDVEGFKVRESQAPVSVAAGTGTSYTSTAAGFAVGTTSIPLITGSGTILAGDTVTFAGDTNKYVVTTGVAAPGTIVLAEPGLRVALAASAVALTVGAAATQNLALVKDSTVAVVRPALQPDGAAFEQMIVSDPISKLSALLLRVPGNALSSWYMRIVYDGFVPNPYQVAQLLG